MATPFERLGGLIASGSTGLTADVNAASSSAGQSLGQAARQATLTPGPSSPGNKRWLQELLLVLGSGALGAGFGAVRRPGGSSLRGAVIGGTAGASGGASFVGANRFMDSDLARYIVDTNMQAPSIAAAAVGGTAAGVRAGRGLADVLGLRGRQDNNPHNDLEELDLTQKKDWLPV